MSRSVFDADKVRWLAAAALDFCLPRRCLFCGAELEPDHDALCPRCEMASPLTGEDAVQYGTHFQRCLSPLYYTGGVKDSFHRYKFQGHWHYSHIYAQWMWECFQAHEFPAAFDFITWTPLSFRRRMSRGYDQSRRLAQGVSRLSGLPLRRTLDKVRHTRAQSGTSSAQERHTNVANVYRLHRGADVAGRHILLVDDIITTGSTLEEASRVLREAGAAELCCLTLARGVRRPHI